MIDLNHFLNSNFKKLSFVNITLFFEVSEYTIQNKCETISKCILKQHSCRLKKVPKHVEVPFEMVDFLFKF